MDDRTQSLWPDGRAFAFSVFDDSDLANLRNVGPVYDFLAQLGLRTTKSVWAVTGNGTPVIGGSTCDDDEYRAWTVGLQQLGFEIGSHGASPATSDRETVARSLDRFRDIYGHDPRSFANHAGCRESIYWGDARVDGVSRAAYNLLTRGRLHGRFRGHVEGDPLFWGDLCRARVRYVRNFTFIGTDTLAACPSMPYFDPRRPFVNAWFAATEGANVDAFVRAVGDENQDSLEASGGLCIMYTHFASGFFDGNRIDPRFKNLMERLASRNGWFAPVSTILDHIVAQRGVVTIDDSERGRVERRWLASKIRVGRS